MKCFMLQMMTQMTIDLNMFFVLVKYVIVSNLNNTQVITIKNGNGIGWDRFTSTLSLPKGRQNLHKARAGQVGLLANWKFFSILSHDYAKRKEKKVF